MNTKVIIGIVVVILIAGVGYMLLKGSSTAPSYQTTNQPTQAVQTNASPSAEAMQANSVSLTSNGYEPATLTIKAGDKVTWTNKSGGPATVNSDPHPTHTNYPPLNLGQFQDGGTLSLTFDKPGTYGYHNHFNPSQKGTIVVQ